MALRQCAIYGKVASVSPPPHKICSRPRRAGRGDDRRCDPKADSTRLILHSKAQTTVMHLAAEAGTSRTELEDVLSVGSRRECVESGGLSRSWLCRSCVITASILEEEAPTRMTSTSSSTMYSAT